MSARKKKLPLVHPGEILLEEFLEPRRRTLAKSKCAACGPHRPAAWTGTPLVDMAADA